MNYAASKERADETVAGLKGDGHVVVQGDVFSRAGVEAVAKEAKEKLGGVDIVISNAGWTKIAPWGNIRESEVASSPKGRGGRHGPGWASESKQNADRPPGSLTDDEWDLTYKANVMAHLWLMQSLEDELKTNKGCFIVSASIAGLRPTGSSMAYCEFLGACALR